MKFEILTSWDRPRYVTPPAAELRAADAIACIDAALAADAIRRIDAALARVRVE
jgi:hypothetical protein